ncbi:MAG: hypothetical protein AAGJ93_17440, partial [Bacteroidota bacterium]
FLISFRVMVVTSAAADTTICNDTTENIVNKFDQISYRWDAVAEDLEQYNGLGAFCLERSYRSEVLALLEEVHHLDSLVYQKLIEMAQVKHNHEVKKTIRQIEELETEFGIKEFSKFLSKECKERREIERKRRDLEGNLGQDSYSGQQQLVESTFIATYTTSHTLWTISESTFITYIWKNIKSSN